MPIDFREFLVTLAAGARCARRNSQKSEILKSQLSTLCALSDHYGMPIDFREFLVTLAAGARCTGRNSPKSEILKSQLCALCDMSDHYGITICTDASCT